MVARGNDWEAADITLIETVSAEARRLLTSGKRREAIALLDDSSEDSSRNPAHARAHLAFIAGAFLQGFEQNDEATVRFQRAVRAEPSNAQYWLGLAGAHLCEGRTRESSGALEQSLSLARTDDFWWWLEPQALGVRGRVLLSDGDQAGAVALLDLFQSRLGAGTPPNPWCDLQLVADLLSRGIEVERCRVYLRAVAAQAASTNDTDLERRIRPLLDQAQA